MSEICRFYIESLPAWGVWIEILSWISIIVTSASLPAWGVWIEIDEGEKEVLVSGVTPRMGSVD